MVKKLTALIFAVITVVTFFATPLQAHDGQTDHTHVDEMFMVGTLKIMKDGKPLPKAEVSAFDQVNTTNDQGIASFDHVMSGEQIVKVIYNKETFVQKIQVYEADTVVTIKKTTPAEPAESASTTSSQDITLRNWIIAGVLGLIAIVILIRIILRHFITQGAFSGAKKKK